jgi:hypothetical protein
MQLQTGLHSMYNYDELRHSALAYLVKANPTMFQFEDEIMSNKHLWSNGVHRLTKVGFDTNGNWSYWMIAPNRKRAVKIQHALIEQQHCIKLTEEILKDGKPAEKIGHSITWIIEEYRRMTGMGRN